MIFLLSAAKQIRESDKETPIIAMTAHAMNEDYTKSIEAGMNDHLTKPVNIERLYDTIYKYISKEKISPEDQPEKSTSKAKTEYTFSTKDYQDKWLKLSELEMLNTNTALENTGDDRELLIKIYNDFIVTGKQVNSQLTEACNNNELDKVIRISHSLKGSCGTIGMTSISKLAEKIETTLRADINSDVNQDCKELSNQLTTFISSLKHIFME